MKRTFIFLLNTLLFSGINGFGQNRPDIYQNGWIDFNKNGKKDIYEDPSANIDDLLSRMTLDEKTCQMVTLYGSGRVLKDPLPTPEWKTAVWKDGETHTDPHVAPREGFERIALNSGEAKRTTFTLTPQDLGIWDINNRFTVEPGSFEVMVGASSQDAGAQNTGGKSFPCKAQILPAALIAGGIGAALAGDFNRKVTGGLPSTRLDIDNYIQYAPMLGMYVADMAGIKTKNTVWNQTKYLALSQLSCAIVTQSLKYTVREQRPNNGARNSFPSGHTSVAFVGATVLYHELKDSNKAMAYSGFVVAAGVGALRMTNRKHWISDVLAGAGIGILSANLVYYFEPLKNWQPFSKSDKTALQPYCDGENTGLSLLVKL